MIKYHRLTANFIIKLLGSIIGVSLLVIAVILAFNPDSIGVNLQSNAPSSPGRKPPTPSSLTISATPTPTPSPTPSPIDLIGCINKLPDQVKIGQKLMFAGYAATLDAQQLAVTQANLTGLILMDQTPTADIASLTNHFTISPIIAVDQEGGNVQRFTSQGKVPGAEDMAASHTTDQAYQLYLGDANYLKSVGITTNFAPVVDVISRQPNPLPGRLFSNNPQTVIDYAKSFIQADQKAGLTPVIKHFPGLGSATGNTDNSPATTDPLSTLQKRDLLPYQQLANLKPDVMVANAVIPDLSQNQPAIWSSDTIKLLRSLGYTDSVIYTDSLTAKAIPGYLSDAAIKAWQADIDIALVVQTRQQTPQIVSLIQTIVSKAEQSLASGQLNPDQVNRSLLRIFNRKHLNPCNLNL